MVMKTYKIGFSSDVYETVEVEAKNTNDAKEKFHKGEIDFSEATASAILSSSNLSALLFNILFASKKKMGLGPFLKFQQCNVNILNLINFSRPTY